MNRIQLQRIAPDFRGSNGLLDSAAKDLTEVGGLARQAIQDRELQKRYETEAARQKVVDDRSKAEYDERASDRTKRIGAMKAAGEALVNILGPGTAQKDATTLPIQTESTSIPVPNNQNGLVVQTPTNAVGTANEAWLKSIDLKNPIGLDGKAYTQGTKYYVNPMNNKLVSEIALASAGAKLDPKVDVKTYNVPTPAVQDLTKVGSKALNKSGYSPEKRQPVDRLITEGYKKVIDALPKDNTAEREAFRKDLLKIYTNIGLDPKDYNVTDTLNSMLPSTVVSDVTKLKSDLLLKGLSARVEQINADRTLTLKERELQLEKEYKRASVAAQNLATNTQAKTAANALRQNASQFKESQKLEREKLKPVGKSDNQALADKLAIEYTFNKKNPPAKETRDAEKHLMDQFKSISESERSGLFGSFTGRTPEEVGAAYLNKLKETGVAPAYGTY